MKNENNTIHQIRVPPNPLQVDRLCRENGREVRVTCSHVQIYMERVYDLLNPPTDDALPPAPSGRPNQQFKHILRSEAPPADEDAGFRGMGQGLRLRWTKQDGFFVENLFQSECRSAAEALDLFRAGVANKVVASHRMNVASSRSHCVFTLQVESWPRGRPEELVKAKLSLVDLAGSERQSAIGAAHGGTLQKESISINKSLFTLRKVIMSLAQKQGAEVMVAERGAPAAAATSSSAHVPYRDSKLTSLLQHSLGGNSFTLMIACLAPCDRYLDDNVSTLQYATLAKSIKNRPTVNEDPKTRLIKELRAQVAFLQDQLARLQPLVGVPLEDLLQPPPKHMRASAAGDGSLEDSFGAREGETLHLAAGGSSFRTFQPQQPQQQGRQKRASAESSGALASSSQMFSPTKSEYGGRGQVLEIQHQLDDYAQDAAAWQQESSTGGGGGVSSGSAQLLIQRLITAGDLVQRLNASNQSIRVAYRDLQDRFGAVQVSHDDLMAENVDLRDRMSILESIVSVEPHRGGHSAFSANPLLGGGGGGGEADAGGVHSTSRAVLMELAELRKENALLTQRLKAGGVPTESGPGLAATTGGSGGSLAGRRNSGGHANRRGSGGAGPGAAPISKGRQDQLFRRLEGDPVAPAASPRDPSKLMSVGELKQLIKGVPDGSGKPARKGPAVGLGGGRPASSASVGGPSSSSSMAFSATTGTSLRVSTTGKLLAQAPGALGMPWLAQGGGEGRGSMTPESTMSASGRIRGGSEQPSDDQLTQLADLISARNTLSRTRYN